MDGLLKNSFRFENFVCIQGQIRKQYFIMHIQYLICTSVFGLNWKLFCGTKEGLLQFLEHLGLGLLICTVNGELLMLKDEKRCFTFERQILLFKGRFQISKGRFFVERQERRGVHFTYLNDKRKTVCGVNLRQFWTKTIQL